MNIGKIPFVWAVCFLSSISVTVSKPNATNKLIYIMLDGFRYDYVDDQTAEALPGFSKLLQNGVRAEYMTAIYPSVSFPDWTTLVTGLWAESHGIVGNYFYDSHDQDVFSLFDTNGTRRKKWWTAEPIWTTTTKANVKTAVILWSLCDVPFDGITPEFCEPFVKTVGSESFRINVEKALDKLEEGYDFIQVYTSHVDTVGHAFGPETEEMKEAVKKLDETFVYLLERIEEMEMTDQVNIIVVSDHGMVTTAPGTVQRVELDDYLLTEYVENVGDAGAFSNIKVKEGHVAEVYKALKSMPGVQVYLHDDIPDDLHFKNNKYIHDILLKADIDTWIMRSRSDVQVPTRNDNFVFYGAHGFDPREEKMRAIFFASGPDFRKDFRIPPIKNVDVYPLLTYLLQVKPQPNNGTFGNIKMALQEAEPPNGKGVSIATGVLPILCAFILAVVA